MFACGGRKSGNFFILKKSGVENLGGADCPRVALAFDWSDFHYSLSPSSINYGALHVLSDSYLFNIEGRIC
jgi:hypothetical protein